MEKGRVSNGERGAVRTPSPPFFLLLEVLVQKSDRYKLHLNLCVSVFCSIFNVLETRGDGSVASLEMAPKEGKEKGGGWGGGEEEGPYS